MRFQNLSLTLWTFACASVACAAEPQVSNVRAAQRVGTKLVDVYYDLNGGDVPATVAVAVSDNGGSSYAVPATSFTGAVGGGVTSGTNKHVVWNAGADWNGQFFQTVKFRITATTPQPVPDGFALIPAGTFTMGGTSGDYQGDNPLVSVYVSAFYMTKHEVTKVLWDEVRAWGLANGYTDLPAGAGKAANHPVQSINWYAGVKWCNARSQRDGLIPCYTVSDVTYKTGNSDSVVCNWSASGYRLPTEAEWEKAARGGLEGQRFPWGTDTISHNQANYWSSSNFSFDVSETRGYHPNYSTGGEPYTSPVGSFAANSYSLHDVSGNIWEWCWDWYRADSYSSGANDPRGPTLRPTPVRRVLRGGSWSDYGSSYCRVAIRYGWYPGTPVTYVGLRLARSLAP